MKRGELDDLAVFATIARTRSFTRAAAELGLSPSTLSHTMRALETRHGVRLLRRTTRSVAPSEAGLKLLERLEPALREVHRGLDDLAHWRRTPSGTLRIATFEFAARTVLAPRLPRFLLDHPDIAVEVVVDDHPADPVAQGFDAGIRLHDQIERDMVAIRVGPDLRIVVVGTPHYFARHEPPETPDDLKDHICINHRMIGGGLLPWEFVEDGMDLRTPVAGRFTANDGALAAAAIRAGAGLGYLMECDVADDIAEGRLIQVLAEWSAPFPGCYLYHPGGEVSPALRALIDALRWCEA